MAPETHPNDERAGDEPLTTPRVESTIAIDAHESTDDWGYLNHVEVRDTPVKIEDDSADVGYGVEVVFWIASDRSQYPYIYPRDTSKIISTTGTHYYDTETFDDEGVPSYTLSAYGYTQAILQEGTYHITLNKSDYPHTAHDESEYEVTITAELASD